MSSHTSPESTISTQDTVEDVTFAVELKFLIRQDMSQIISEYGSVRNFVPHRPAELRESMTESETRLQRDNWDAVARAIDALSGVNAIASHAIQAQRRDLWKTHWLVYKANSACPPYLSYLLGDPDRPVFDTNAPDFGTHVWTPVEVCSPILYWAHKTKGLATLTRIIEMVNRQFSVVANASTECHVHVGRSDGKLYTLKTMKQFATLLWLSEPLLRALKNPESPNFDHHYTWSYPWREKSRIAMALSQKPPGGQTIDELYHTGKALDFDAFLAKLNNSRLTWNDERYTYLQEHRKALRAIWCAANHQELAQMLRGPDRKLRRLGFNFYALEADAADESIPRTIEFRFLEGFIDDKIVPAWVRLCGELIDLATAKGQEDGDDWELYNVVALLLTLPQDGLLETHFSAFMQGLGRERVPRWVHESLQAVVRAHYPPRNIHPNDQDLDDQ